MWHTCRSTSAERCHDQGHRRRTTVRVLILFVLRVFLHYVTVVMHASTALKEVRTASCCTDARNSPLRASPFVCAVTTAAESIPEPVQGCHDQGSRQAASVMPDVLETQI